MTSEDRADWQSLINQEMLDLEHRMRRVEDLLATQAATVATRTQLQDLQRERFRWIFAAVMSAVSCVALVLSLHLF